jgi:hypothetical protein
MPLIRVNLYFYLYTKMGALTAKTREFTYRVWEQKSSIEIDDTEVYLYKIRSENLKVKRVRILPVNYWMSDLKRFSLEVPVTKDTAMFFKELRYLKLNRSLCETKYINYLISSIKGYKKILDVFFNLQDNLLNCFIAKKPKVIIGIHNNLTIMNDLLINRMIINHIEQPSLTVDNFHNDILLLTNPRLDSPVLNVFLFKHVDNYTFTSFSTFASNITKQELPFSNYSFIASLQGHYNLKNKTIITSCLNISPAILKLNPRILSPIYMSRIWSPYNNETLKKQTILSTAKAKYIFYKSFIGNNHQESSILLPKHVCDKFTLKKVNQKWLTRLFFNINLVKATETDVLYPIRHLTLQFPSVN